MLGCGPAPGQSSRLMFGGGVRLLLPVAFLFGWFGRWNVAPGKGDSGLRRNDGGVELE